MHRITLYKSQKFNTKQLSNKCNNDKIFLEQIDNICEFGNCIDKYIKNDNRFFELKYIIDALNTEDDYNVFTKYIYDKDNVINNKIEFVKLIIQIRNKIAYCNTSGLYKKPHKYKNEYMKHYYFDYYEYSEEKWIYLNLSCRLNTILADILYSN